ncbi:MAG: NYN domain-containing protein [Acidobacteriota bacterium]|jgi:hypothetical protein|nr:NYN domain-containing protein [Acidobacteriota bacterium]
MTYWFDGNNLIGLSAAAARRDRRTRVEFLAALGARRKSGGGRMVVWFDGDDPADASPPPGVAVRYSAPESADAAICRRLREIERPGEVTVVTGDRELAARCRAAGASTMDWGRFAAKVLSRPAAAPRVRAIHLVHPEKSPAPGDAIDVDGWMRYFGMDGGADGDGA